MENISQSKIADLVLKNGKIATVDENFSIMESVAIKDGIIIFVGNNDDVAKFIDKNTQVIDLSDKLVTPGMVDAHGHLFNLGKDEEDVFFSVRNTCSWDEVVALVKQKIQTMKPDEWLIGGGWYQDDWEDNTIPAHDGLSSISPDNPVFLYRRGGNSAFVNQKALEIAGISKNTEDPYGGKIGRKDDGSPSGFLVNMGNNLVKKHFPKPNKPLEWYMDIFKRAAKRCNEVGLTGVHDAGIDPILIDAYKKLVDTNQLTLRVNGMLQNPREGNLEEYFLKHRLINYGGNHLFQVRSVKVFFDGALGSRGAALAEPYDDDPNNNGLFEVPPEHVFDVSVAALKAKMQVCAHAIGDRGNSVYLDIIEKALNEVPIKDHRFRSEHAEILKPEDVKRFALLNVIPSVQPIHHTSDMEFLIERLGAERARIYASPWRSLIDAGSKIPCGSDFTIYSHNPLTGFYAAITRKREDGTPEDGFYSDQCMTRE
ncbi:MAG: amidohydrolase [Asgard group archaeon]|nr:amidohydrolase [Asgard group archaeon]